MAQQAAVRSHDRRAVVAGWRPCAGEIRDDKEQVKVARFLLEARLAGGKSFEDRHRTAILGTKP
jgi:hypothetical protein